MKEPCERSFKMMKKNQSYRKGEKIAILSAVVLLLFSLGLNRHIPSFF
jgi:hypothetical protein